MQVARVTTRIGDDLLGVTEVASRYTVGSEPGCDFAATDIGMFALVTADAQGFLVRRPIGLALAIDGRASTSLEARLVRGSITTLQLGLATLEIALVDRAPKTLPFTDTDLRSVPFIAVSLVAHLTLVALALTHPHRDKKLPSRIVAHPRLAHLAPLPLPPPPVRPEPSRVAASKPAGPRGHVASHAPRLPGGSVLAEVDVGGSVAALVAASANLQANLDAATFYNPEMDGPGGFGGAVAMDLRTRPGWGNIEIKTGVYKTISHDRDAPSANDMATTQQLALCESYACQATGPLSTDQVKLVVETHMAQIATCTGRWPSFKVALDIAPDGTAKAHGESSYVHCVSDALVGLSFPKAREPTHVDFTVGFPAS